MDEKEKELLYPGEEPKEEQTEELSGQGWPEAENEKEHSREITNEHVAEDTERTKRFKSRILSYLMKKKYKELREETLDMHPADLASVLEDLDENNRLVVFRLLARLAQSRRGRHGILSRTNRFLGGVLGILEAMAVVYALAFAMNALANLVQADWISPRILSETYIVRRLLL